MSTFPKSANWPDEKKALLACVNRDAVEAERHLTNLQKALEPFRDGRGPISNSHPPGDVKYFMEALANYQCLFGDLLEISGKLGKSIAQYLAEEAKRNC